MGTLYPSRILAGGACLLLLVCHAVLYVRYVHTYCVYCTMLCTSLLMLSDWLSLNLYASDRCINDAVGNVCKCEVSVEYSLTSNLYR